MTSKKKQINTIPIAKYISLRKYGYTINKSDIDRIAALNTACVFYGTRNVLMHLNSIRNIHTDEKSKKIMSFDIKYLKQIYKKFQKNNNLM